MPRRWRKWLLVLGLIPLLLLGFDRVQKMYWVGHTNLEIEFVITAAHSGQPIPGARIEIQPEREEQNFVVDADTDGMARKECRECMCFGTVSGLRFTDTFAVHLPWWLFRVSAPGFESSEWVDLTVSDFLRRVYRAGPGKAKLVIPVSLQKKPAKPIAAIARRYVAL
jgi:hypothetical protein